MDPVAMVEYAVDDSKVDLLEAVLDQAELPSEFLSSMLLNAAWNDDRLALEVTFPHRRSISRPPLPSSYCNTDDASAVHMQRPAP